MSSLRSGTPGATRVCPHCKATVLETAAICPGCRHHLRFSAEATQAAADEGYCALSVDGSISHKVSSEPCEYFVVLDIRDERGEQLARQVVGVGVLQPGELRHLHVSVGMRPVRAQVAARPQPSLSAASTPASAQPAATVMRAPPQPAPVVESRLQPRPTGKPTSPGSTGGSSPRFRNFHKP
ncbi:MAG TPA: hypothetical protein VHN17_08680 [Steroidobacteraceae bacterium]|jgi:hypothetical protein|nr:hypothetical protein [Steroidobacteraceae bacterium]